MPHHPSHHRGLDALILVEGPLADAAGEDFETAWLKVVDTLTARSADG